MGLSQGDLATRVGVTSRSIIGYEQGTTTIRMDILYRLSEIGVDVPYVLFGDGTEGMGRVDQALFDRVNRWADETCRDRGGKPIPEWERAQRVSRAYRWLASSGSKEELEDRFSKLPPSRVA